MNPVTRWTPQQARLHPFITGEKFSKPFIVSDTLVTLTFVLRILQPDGHVMTQHQNPTAAGGASDPKRPYGGLISTQPKATRPFQDAAAYNHQLAQHQAYTAQAQAASQAATAFRNPYISPQNAQQLQQQQQQAQGPSNYSNSSDGATYQTQQSNPYPQGQSATAQRAITHQASTGQLGAGGSVQQYPTHAPPQGHLNPNVPSNSYFPNSRARANTINNHLDSVPPALARLQQMNQDVIAGRNALTPVLNRDDAMREWERRQTGKPPAAQPYPQLEFLQQQAEMVSTSGLTNWGNAHTRYPPPPSKLGQSYNPQTIMVDDDNNGRREAVMSNVRSAARNENTGPLYGNSGIIASPPQVYPANSTASRYPAASYQQATTSPFDSLDRRTDIGNMYVPMQPDQYQSYAAATPSTATRHIQPPAQSASSFYGPSVVTAGQPQQQRNPFSIPDGSQQNASGAKDVRRGNGIDAWPR